VVNERYSVFLKRQWLGTAELVMANRFTFVQLTEGMALLDTGYTKVEVQGILRKMYEKYLRQYGNNAEFGFYIFKYQQGEQKQVV